MPPRRALFDAALYTFANSWAAGLALIASIAARTLVVPAAFGASAYVRSICTYLGSYNGVYRNAIDREVPSYRAQGKSESVDSVLEVSYTLLFLSVLLESAVLGGIALVVQDLFLRLAFFTMAVVNFFDSLAIADKITLKATVRFRALAAVQLIGSVPQATVLIIFSWLWGFYGYFLALAAAAAIRLAISRFFLKQGWRAYLFGALEWSIVRDVLSVGTGIALLTLTRQLALTLDRFFVVGFLSLTDLGYYSLGSSMVSTLFLLPNSISGAFFPRMMGLFSTGQLNQVRNTAWNLQATIVLTMAVAFGGLALVISPMVEFVLPDYLPAVPVFEIMIIGGYLFGAQAVALQLHMGMRQLRIAILIGLTGAGIAAFLNFMLVGFGLIGVATASSIALGIFALLLNLSGERILQTHGLVLWLLTGLLLLGGLYSVLHVVGRNAGILYLVALAGGSTSYLTRLHQIRWRQLPAMVSSYLSRGVKGEVIPSVTEGGR
ncbi:hypothetical protein MYX65_00055 [Acidobacteria bacterium AH-259-L09]|nr:hypothetical protein [Acidobacteria bacterium AH-259-L09]